MSEDDAPLRKHLGQVPQTQLIAHPLQDDQRDNISGILETIVGCPCPFIETALTRATAETTVAQFGAMRTFGGGGRLTVWTCHSSSSFRRCESIPFMPSSQGNMRSDRTSQNAARPVVRLRSILAICKRALTLEAVDPVGNPQGCPSGCGKPGGFSSRRGKSTALSATLSAVAMRVSHKCYPQSQVTPIFKNFFSLFKTF
jgi:hypothetical protein